MKVVRRGSAKKYELLLLARKKVKLAPIPIVVAYIHKNFMMG